MARIKKRGTSGQAKNYITRTQAVRKLQVSLADFRRLCIFKGIYPREPRNKKKASRSSTASTTFYYTRDIQYLLHEPLLNKFRDHKALGKKISKALGRNEISDAKRLEQNLTPRMTLDHVIKERYPTFVDALRDLDDCLSMLFLFANLPQTDTVPPRIIGLCQRLTLEFEHFVIRSHSLRKSFLSIKGIYYQATIQGQDILWLVPYKFVQRVTGDVDFRIMGTFVEFYTTLLGFVNYRLYTSIGLVYPPKFDLESVEKGGELGAFKLQGSDAPKSITNGTTNSADHSSVAQDEANRIITDREDVETHPEGEEQSIDQEDAIEEFTAIDASADTLIQPSISTTTVAALFEPFTIYLSRETPRHPLEFVLRAFGCKRVAWDSIVGDGSYTDESDQKITHQIVDRPLPLAEQDSTAAKTGQRVPGRTYIQPQWVWDCLNAGKLLRTDLYAPGATLPPHLSPFVKPRKGEYDPTKTLEEQETEGEAAAAAEQGVYEEADDDMANGADAAQQLEDETLATVYEDEDGKDIADMDVELATSDDDAESNDADQVAAEDDEWSGIDSEGEDANPDNLDPASSRQHHAELQAEAQGLNVETDSSIAPGKAVATRKRERAAREKKEEQDRQKMMLSRKKRKLFEKMTYGNERRDEEAEKLRAKRRKMELKKQKG